MEIWPKNRGRLMRSWGLIAGVMGAIPLGGFVALIPGRIGLDLAVK